VGFPAASDEAKESSGKVELRISDECASGICHVWALFSARFHRINYLANAVLVSETRADAERYL
jgi:hypothetical protein